MRSDELLVEVLNQGQLESGSDSGVGLEKSRERLQLIWGWASAAGTRKPRRNGVRSDDRAGGGSMKVMIIDDEAIARRELRRIAPGAPAGRGGG